MSHPKGLQGWHIYHASRYGLERWKSALYPALKAPVQHICLPRRIFNLPPEVTPHPTLPGAFVAPSDLALDAYFIDGASVACALALSPQPGDKVLDMCSAPGGKSIVIARTMTAGTLVCNELSKPRLARLKQSVAEYGNLSDDLTVTFINHDATSASGDLSRIGPYNRILLDAACSSDRHLLSDPAALAGWSYSAVKENSERQFKMLQAAAKLLRPGGTIVYSTCALADAENDEVIERFLGKNSTNFQIHREPRMHEWVPGAEDTKFGVLMLPDRSEFGPLYVAILKKSDSLVMA
jgi:16S rRNA C967 or C1407 C5-methylase (RsmB/RsmF family)